MAPPYGVTAYLATFARKNEFSKPVNFVMSYIFVIATTEILHSVLGFSIIVVLTNVIMVSAFISFTRFKHPPAIALTIFSYIIHETDYFIFASLAVLPILVTIHVLVNRLNMII
jgi:hypothetical protein